ncbi:MAG: hypothetical protein WB626_08470 [Bacteroidota bacterium]
MKTRHILLLLVPLAFSLRCTDTIADRPIANSTPVTYLWLYPDSTVGVGVSRQHLRWWGEDPDGLVRGFLFAYAAFGGQVGGVPAPDTLAYTWVTGNDTLISFPLDTLFRTYTVFVRAVDNSVRLPAALEERSRVRMNPEPFVDANVNGVLDGGDTRLEGLGGAVDPRGAVRAFPIRNTPPTIAFVLDPRTGTAVMKQPETTYTAATFAWTARDADGSNTLASYRIALNDTSDPSRWLTVPVRDTVVTIVVPRARSDIAGAEVDADVYGGVFLSRQFLGTLRGLRLDDRNVLFVQARDVAGEYSTTIAMPSGTDRWFVRRPRGRLLLVGDYINSDSASARLRYRAGLAAVPGGGFSDVDELNIGRGLRPEDKRSGKTGILVPPFIDPALIYTFLLYDQVLWYTEALPSLGVAQLTLFTYMQNGGKVLFSTTFESSTDARGALNDFAPIDSVSSAPFTPRPAPGDTRVPGGYRVYADSSLPGEPYPPLAFVLPPAPLTFHSIFMRPLYRRSDARYIYRLQPDTANSPPRYIGSPNVAVVDGQRTIVFIGLSLHLLDNTAAGQGMGAFLERVLLHEFNPAHAVNRRRF